MGHAKEFIYLQIIWKLSIVSDPVSIAKYLLAKSESFQNYTEFQAEEFCRKEPDVVSPPCDIGFIVAVCTILDE